MLSAAGRCATFDQDADGMVAGGAVTALALRPLADAETAGDPVHSVIAASGLNHDGRTNGITAPSGDAQRELLESVCERGGIDPADLGYVVTHGTGMKLGDPVEVGALRAVFARHTDERGFCALTSTKPNVGHTFAASGLVGLVCLSEALRHRAIPPSLHCERDNEYIDWNTSSSLRQQGDEAVARPRHGHRTGAVSAFGMSGTNAHVVVRGVHRPAGHGRPGQSAYLLGLRQDGHGPGGDRRRPARPDRDRRPGRTRTCPVSAPHSSPAVTTSGTGARWWWPPSTRPPRSWRAWRRSRTAAPGACFEGVVPRGFTARAQDADRLPGAADRARDTGLDPAARREALVEVAHGYVAGHTVPTAVAPARRPPGHAPAAARVPVRAQPLLGARRAAGSGPEAVTTAEQSPPPAAPAPRRPGLPAGAPQARRPAGLGGRTPPDRHADAAPAAARPQVSLAPPNTRVTPPGTGAEAPSAPRHAGARRPERTSRRRPTWTSAGWSRP